jgi:AmmeMemoRadiSam system protein B/AmmeMemoRadiSam system protein A
MIGSPHRIPGLATRFVPLFAAVCLLSAVPGSVRDARATDTRAPAVAGQFYPADPGKLRLAIEQFLKGSTARIGEKPDAILVPHAGYIYSGQIAADAYRQVMGRSYDTVVILGVNHTTGNFRGVSVGDYGAFQTPLGSVAVDEEIISALLTECRDCVRSREVHVNEHSIEVQIPFIQVLFPKARIVPAIIHPPDLNMCVRFGEALAKVLRNRQALIVISSDLSHYPSHQDGSNVDRLTLETISSLNLPRISSLMRNLDGKNLETRACGEASILAGIAAAKGLGAKRAVIVGYANSGDDLIGDRSRTVGYGAVVFVPGETTANTPMPGHPVPPPSATPLQNPEKKALLEFARESIQRYLTTQTLPLPRNLPARVYFPQGAFVTLRKHGELRGCIGHMTPDIELGQTVGAMALQAAFNDPRFPPVQQSELKDIEIEISVLTPMKSAASFSEIVVGRDGVLLSKSGSSAVFLPQVATENHWNRSEMLDNLCRKAGLATGCWQHEAKFQTFQAEVFSESQYR